MNAKEQLSGMVSNRLLIDAMDKAFEDRRERLNEAVQELDNALGADPDPEVVAAIERFVQAMWKEF